MDLGIAQNIMRGNETLCGDTLVTPIDLDSIQEDPSKIKEFIISKAPEIIDLSEKEMIERFNLLYQKTISYLQDELFYEKSDLGKLPGYSFDNWNDIVCFIGDTKKIKGKSKCTILKYMLVINDASEKFNPRIKEVRDKTQRVLEKKLKGPLQILEENEDGDIRGVVSLQGESIDFILKKREKTNNSNISKQIRDPKYNSVGKTSDQYGVTFSNLEERKIPMLMEYISQIVFKKGVYNIKNQDAVSRESISSDPYISSDFSEKILEAINGNKKDETAKNYKVIKLVTPLYKDDETNNLSLEIKFEPEQSRNEIGIQMQGVYAYFKKIAERIRTEHYIRPEYVELIADKFIENLQDTLDKNINRENKDLHTYKLELFNSLRKSGHISTKYDLRNQHTKSHIDDLLHMGLVCYYKSKLRPTTINGKGKTYLTNSRNLEISNFGFWRNELIAEN